MMCLKSFRLVFVPFTVICLGVIMHKMYVSSKIMTMDLSTDGWIRSFCLSYISDHFGGRHSPSYTIPWLSLAEAVYWN